MNKTALFRKTLKPNLCSASQLGLLRPSYGNKEVIYFQGLPVRLKIVT